MLELQFIIGVAVGFVVGIFVYRNNVDLFAPFAEKLDQKFDEVERRLNERLAKLEKQKK
jgi:hypothetical protein